MDNVKEAAELRERAERLISLIDLSDPADICDILFAWKDGAKPRAKDVHEVASAYLALAARPADEAVGITGVSLIAAERARQIAQEGWTAEHDDEYRRNELCFAAYAYTLPEDERPGVTDANGLFTPSGWPWKQEWWKPTPDDRIRELVKAGALIAAEIDRLQRAIDLKGATT